MAGAQLSRLEDIKPCKKLTFSQPGGSKRTGRHKLRWLDGTLRNLQKAESAR